ncbi:MULTISPECIES: putative porin [Shewanella]|uniref:putative porin n=1 Tax=Shewanella TaxID=22 RepID=UPI000C5DA420|nr:MULTISPECIES: putative porin [Shewanella]NCQ44213.1 putative porin [Shewanella frigidimarina]NCO71140.1 putative porin [Shewanella vesiculosa]NCP35174.1 putative porin [Shewanella vesiculosa]NCP69849.1 putative porin [Shewanella vesiculosa]NCP73218.1 putative porin [Shewanella vesiculosa]
MKNVTALALVLGFVALPAMAAQDAPFHHEASLGYSANTEEFGDGLWDLNYRFYLDSVSQEKGPYALNGFLAQSTNVGASYKMQDDIDLDIFSVDGTYVFDSKWFVGAKIERYDVGSFDTDTYQLDLGYYFNDSSKVAAFYVDGSDIDSIYGLEVRSFIDLKNTTGVDLGTKWTHTDADDIFNVNADWYVTKSWSVGLGYDDNGSDDNFTAKTAYWLRMSDAFSATFELGKVLDSDVDGLFVGVGVVGRF